MRPKSVLFCVATAVMLYAVAAAMLAVPVLTNPELTGFAIVSATTLALAGTVFLVLSLVAAVSNRLRR